MAFGSGPVQFRVGLPRFGSGQFGLWSEPVRRSRRFCRHFFAAAAVAAATFAKFAAETTRRITPAGKFRQTLTFALNRHPNYRPPHLEYYKIPYFPVFSLSRKRAPYLENNAAFSLHDALRSEIPQISPITVRHWRDDCPLMSIQIYDFFFRKMQPRIFFRFLFPVYFRIASEIYPSGALVR
jgi:hypothetical protein